MNTEILDITSKDFLEVQRRIFSEKNIQRFMNECWDVVSSNTNKN